jgi:hypothetical protein
VLLTAKRAVYDWDPASTAPPLGASLGEAAGGAEGPIVAAQSGSARFVVAWPDAHDRLAPELWDATTLTKIQSMSTAFAGMQPMTATSPDGSRFVVLGCKSARDQALDCEATVYDLTRGSLVHITKLPTFETGPYMIDVQLSEDGRWFSLSNEFFPSEVRSSDTGSLVVRSPDSSETYFHESSTRVLFVDATHALNAWSFGGKMQVTDLASGRTLRTIDLHTSVSGGDFTSGQQLSPDRKKVALVIKRTLGSEAAVWSLDDGKYATYSIPNNVCPHYCELAWVGSKLVVAYKTAGVPSQQWRVNLDTGEPLVEPFSPPTVFDVAGFRVTGDVGVSRFGGDSVFGIRDNGPMNGAGPKGTLETPSGAIVDLGPILAHSVHARFGRFLDFGGGAVRVISSDGSIAKLDGGSKRR